MYVTRVVRKAQAILVRDMRHTSPFSDSQTWSYGAAWKDSVTFWSYNLKHNPQSWSSHTYLGHALITAGRARSTPFPILSRPSP